MHILHSVGNRNATFMFALYVAPHNHAECPQLTFNLLAVEANDTIQKPVEWSYCNNHTTAMISPPGCIHRHTHPQPESLMCPDVGGGGS